MKGPARFYLPQLLAFALLLREELTWPTLAVVAGALVLRGRGRAVPAWVPKLAGATLFGLAFMEHGWRINPEMGLNILLGVVTLKLLEAAQERDWRMLTLGFFLLWSTGALFVKTPLYMGAALAGLALGMLGLVRALGEEVAPAWRELLWWVARALPVAAALFFFLPRFSANVWMPPTPPSKGEIGFSEEARPSDVEELRPTGALAFHVEVVPAPPRERLYWRGATLSGHDGWNWFPAPLDAAWSRPEPGGRVAAAGWTRQSIIHPRPVSRAFSLRLGQWASFDGRDMPGSPQGTWLLPPLRQWRRYLVWSDPSSTGPALSPHEQRTLAIGPSLKKIPGTGLERGRPLAENLRALRGYLGAGFTYSLAPGRVPTLGEFLRGRKGWCAHYASAAALLLRAAGHPTRLVSGYLGGEHHERGDYWTVSEDDAHVWVESWDGAAWVEVDPTVWVVPERLAYSGGEFMRRRQGEGPPTLPGWLRDTQARWEHFNFRFLVWSEGLDRETQRGWARALDWDLSRFYLAGLGVLAAGILGWWAREAWRSRPRGRVSERRRVWESWRRWWGKRGVELLPSWGPQEWRRRAEALPPAERAFALEWAQAWEDTLYAGVGDEASGLRALRGRLKGGRTAPAAFPRHREKAGRS